MEEALLLPEAVPAPLVYPTLKESWAALGWFLLITMGLVLLVLLPIKAIFHVTGLAKSVLTISIAVLSNGVLVLWLRRRTAAGRWLGLRWRGPRRPWVAFGLLLPIVPALAVVLSVQGFLRLPRWSAGKLLAELAAHPALALVLGCVAAPILEEMLFRGVLLPGLLRNYRPAVAIGQSALLFGIFHFNPAQSLNAFFIGLLLGWVYYQSRSLWLCIGLHGLYNALAFGANRLPGLANAKQLSALMQQPSYALLWLAAALVLAVSLLVMARSQATPTST
ncbi:MAG: CPBP family intramembrane glutamic endopeptidase [Janthinobacterium lividum]